MSRLAFALHTPPGHYTDQRDVDLRRLQIDLDQHEQCRKAFMQAPSPRLGKALHQLEASIRHQQQALKKKGWL
jgi:hypothetical protein